MNRLTYTTTIIVAASALATLVLTRPADAATPGASWRCIAGICVGHSRVSFDYKYGRDAPNLPSRTVKVKGGRVWACFWRCFNAVTEDGFTYYGGTMRPANRLLTVSTCDPVVRLPDGVTVGTTIPFGQRWRGYRRITGYLEGGAYGWTRIAQQRETRTRILLNVNRGRVTCVTLEQP